MDPASSLSAAAAAARCKHAHMLHVTFLLMFLSAAPMQLRKMVPLC
jgi:hypothetical protein